MMKQQICLFTAKAINIRCEEQMVLIIKKEKRSRRIDYDYWNEIQWPNVSSRNEFEYRKGK